MSPTGKASMALSCIMLCLLVVLASHEMSSDDRSEMKTEKPVDIAEVPKEIELSAQEKDRVRLEVFDRFWAGMNLLVSESQDEEALSLMHFLESRLVPVGVSGEHSFYALRNANATDPIHFLVLLPGDEEVAPQFKPLLNSSALAWHINLRGTGSSMRDLIIASPKASKFSLVACGSVMIHEGKHAYDRISGFEPEVSNLLDRARSERRAHELTQRLLRIYGGSNFESAIAHYAALIKQDPRCDNLQDPKELGLLYDSIELEWSPEVERVMGGSQASIKGSSSEAGEIVMASYFSAAGELFPGVKVDDVRERFLLGVLSRN